MAFEAACGVSTVLEALRVAKSFKSAALLVAHASCVHAAGTAALQDILERL